MNSVLFAKMDQVFSKENKTLKNILENWKKILEKSGKSQRILSVLTSGNPVDNPRDKTSHLEMFPGAGKVFEIKS